MNSQEKRAFYRTLFKQNVQRRLVVDRIVTADRNMLPTARPNPRMDAPISPVFAYGNIAGRNISCNLVGSKHVCCLPSVAAERPSKLRAILHQTVGIIIMASTTLAVSMSRPSGTLPDKMLFFLESSIVNCTFPYV